MAVPAKLVYRYNTIPVKIPTVFFYRNEQADPTIHVEFQGTQTSPNNFERVTEFTLPDFKPYSKETIFKAVWHKHNHNHKHVSLV